MKKNVIIKTFVLALGLSLIAIFAHALDYPHTNYPSTLTNIINCGDCHFSHGTPPWDTSPNNIDETFYNNLCWTCHEGVIATDVKTHSSLQTDNSYGDWTIQCWECHDAHVHEQPDTYGAPSYLDSGTSEAITDLNQITKTGAGWTTDQFAGMMVIPDTSNDYYVYQIISNTADPDNTLTVNGPMNLTLGNTYDFAIFYGRLVRSTIDAPDISTCSVVANEFICTTYTPQTARFFRNTGTKSFADGDATYDGVCEVCHTQTTYHKDDGTGASHNAGVDCTTCHKHLQGFKGTGECMTCHNIARSEVYNTRQIVENAGDGGGDFVRLSRHVSDGTSTEIVTSYDCVVCHAEGDADALVAETGWTSSSKHNDGSTSTTRMVNLRNVDNYSGVTFDFNKNTVDETMRDDMDTFCLSCHDSDGAADINVDDSTDLLVVNDSTYALNPFNSNDNLNSGNTNRDGLTRTRVIDVKSQFYAGTGGSGTGYNGNPSQHAVLGARYSTTNSDWLSSAWTNHTLRNGDTINSVRETATLHCSDCHLSETNAHGAVNAWHMLLNGTPNDFTTDEVMTGRGPRTYPESIVCYKCHNSAVYTGNNPTSGVSRVEHDEDTKWDEDSKGAYGRGDSAKLGPACLLCHAGDNFGNIHGVSGMYDPSNPTLPPSGSVYTRYRFMPGAWLQWSPGGGNSSGTSGDDSDWNLTTKGTCYFPNSSSWSNCSAHNGNPGTKDSNKITPNYGRPTKY